VSLAGSANVSWRNFVCVIVTKMRAHVIDDISNLVVAEQRSKFWHRLLAISDHRDRISSNFELWVACQGRIHPSAYRASCIRHMAILTKTFENCLSPLLLECTGTGEAALGVSRHVEIKEYPKSTKSGDNDFPHDIAPKVS
jgi:hypothetical protein